MSKFSHSQHKSIFDAAFDIPYLALFRYPQIIPLQIQALTPCTSESWEEIVFILNPNHSNERFFLESEASPPTTLQEFFFTFKISLADSYF